MKLNIDASEGHWLKAMASPNTPTKQHCEIFIQTWHVSFRTWQPTLRAWKPRLPAGTQARVWRHGAVLTPTVTNALTAPQTWNNNKISDMRITCDLLVHSSPLQLQPNWISQLIHPGLEELPISHVSRPETTPSPHILWNVNPESEMYLQIEFP